MKVKLHGHSDDIVYVQHEDPNRAQELYLYNGDVGFLHFLESGDVFRVEYDKDGVWRFFHHVKGSACNVELTVSEEVGGDGHSDVVLLELDVPIAQLWGTWPISDSDVVDKLESEDVVAYLLPEERLAVLRRILNSDFNKEYGR